MTMTLHGFPVRPASLPTRDDPASTPIRIDAHGIAGARLAVTDAGRARVDATDPAPQDLVRGDHHEPTRERPRGGLPPGALRRVRETMERRLTEGIRLRELAVVAGLSEFHFARAFKQSVGHAPHQYLMLRRIEVASDLIKTTEQPLADISLEVGFSDQSHFSRMFTRITGETPRAYRRRHR